MRSSHAILLTTLMLGVCAVAQASSEVSPSYNTIPEPIQRVDSIVNNFRKITVLTQGSDRLDRLSREKVEALTWTLSLENQGRLSDLMLTFTDSDGHPLASNIELFLDRIERPGLYKDGDRLAFENVFETLYASRARMSDSIRKRLEDEMSNVRKIRSYDSPNSRTDSKKFLGNSTNSAWGMYVSFLNENYSREQLLKEHASILPRR